MLLSTALALSMIKFAQMPVGGSVSFSCLALILIGARHGFRVSLISGLLFGVLLLINGPTIAHPLQFILDYPLAYSSFGFAGIFIWNTPLKAVSATTLANIVRLHSHVVAGAVFFATDKATVTQAIIASYAYNLTHLLPETIACGLFAFYLVKNKSGLAKRQLAS